MIVLAYVGSRCIKFRAAGEHADFLHPFIWSNAISHWIQQVNSVKFYANLEKSVTDAQAVIRQAFGDESMSHTQKVQTCQD
jgi:hypothetical protein